MVRSIGGVKCARDDGEVGNTHLLQHFHLHPTLSSKLVIQGNNKLWQWHTQRRMPLFSIPGTWDAPLNRASCLSFQHCGSFKHLHNHRYPVSSSILPPPLVLPFQLHCFPSFLFLAMLHASALLVNFGLLCPPPGWILRRCSFLAISLSRSESHCMCPELCFIGPALQFVPCKPRRHPCDPRCHSPPPISPGTTARRQFQVPQLSNNLPP